MKTILTILLMLSMGNLPAFSKSEWKKYLAGFGKFIQVDAKLPDTVRLKMAELGNVKPGRSIDRKYVRNYLPSSWEKDFGPGCNYYYGNKISCNDYTYAIVFRKQNASRIIGSLLCYENDSLTSAMDIYVNENGRKSTIYLDTSEGMHPSKKRKTMPTCFWSICRYSLDVTEWVDKDDFTYYFSRRYRIYPELNRIAYSSAFIWGPVKLDDVMKPKVPYDAPLDEFPSSWDEMQRKYGFRLMDVTGNDYLNHDIFLYRIITGKADEKERLRKIVNVCKDGYLDNTNYDIYLLLAGYISEQMKKCPEILAEVVKELTLDEQESLWRYMYSYWPSAERQKRECDEYRKKYLGYNPENK